jgi:hypothetical protein
MTAYKKKKGAFDDFAIELPKGPLDAPTKRFLSSGKRMIPEEMPPVIRSAYDKWQKLSSGDKPPTP